MRAARTPDPKALAFPSIEQLLTSDRVVKLPALTHLRLAQTAIDFEALCQSELPQSLRRFALYAFRPRQAAASPVVLSFHGRQRSGR